MKRMLGRMTSLMLILTLAIGITVARAWAAEEKDAKEEKDATISLDKLPAAVKATILAQGNGAEIKGIEKEKEDGKTVYSADLIKDKAEVEITVSEDGKLLASETKIALSDAPGAVKATVEQKIEIEKAVMADGTVSYEADVKIDGKKYEIQIDPDGKVLKKEAAADEKDEADEKAEADEAGKGWIKEFNEKPENLGPTGENPYFILEPGYRLVLTGTEDGKPRELTVTVLDETKNVDGVETRVVEERETRNGQIEEVSRNFFAFSKATGNVYYFGEDSKTYKNGKVSGSEGSWQTGAKKAKYGLGMPANPKVGMKYYQELAPKAAMDRAKVVSLSATLKTPAGNFENCLQTEESSALEKGKETKIYAKGIGLLKDEDLLLAKHGFIGK